MQEEKKSTFEQYCKEKWGMKRAYARTGTIEAFKAAETVSPIRDKPISKSQVCPLAHLPPEEQKKVWSKAVEIGGGAVMNGPPSLPSMRIKTP